MRRPSPYVDAEAMPSSSDPQLTGNHAPVPDETTLTSLTVEGSLPTALTGRYIRIGPNAVDPSATAAGRSPDGMVHAVVLKAGCAVSYRNRWVITDNVARNLGVALIPGPPAAAFDIVATNVIAFGGRTLALGQGALAYELDEQLATVGRVDLAGHGRGIGAHPQLDPLTGALHLVSYGDEPAHHIVAPTGHTRITVPVPDGPGPLQDLLLTRDRIVVLGDGFIGITARNRDAQIRWIGVELTDPVTAHDAGDALAVITAGSSLDRWTVDTAGRVDRHVLDHTPESFGITNPAVVDAPRFLWSIAAGNGTVLYRHDLRTGERASHDLGTGRHPGEFTFVADPDRRHCEDGGWLIGLVHDEHRNQADLVVVDAADVERPALATVRISRRIPYGLHGTWIPVT
jgi:carotenoid cleavage dioxygenase